MQFSMEMPIPRLQRTQNMSATLILNRNKYDSSKQALHDLHWLPMKARINFKLLTYMFNCSVGNAPKYLIELLCSKATNRTLRSSESTVGCFDVPFNKNKTFSDRSFSTIGPKLWNELPIHVRNSHSINSFKKDLKAHLFREFFALF